MIEETEIPDSVESTRIKGAVKWFNVVRGYGFVSPDDGSSDVFLHMTVLRQAGLKVKVEGSGKVLWQSPRPGTIKNIGDICIVHLE